MEIVNANIPRDCTIALFSDMHLGNVNCHKDLIRDMVARVGSKMRSRNPIYAVNLGDNLDSIDPKDKRYCHASVDFKDSLMTPQAQAKAVVELLAPIKKQLLAIGEGNHEAKLWNTASFGQQIAHDLSVPFGGYNYILNCADKKTGEALFKFFCSHGSGRLPKGAKDPIQRKANKAAHLRRKLEATGISDCIGMFMGHTHQLLAVAPSIEDELLLTTDNGKIHQHTRPHAQQNSQYIPPDRRWFGNTGGFLKLYSPPGSKVFGYAEIALMEPTKLGWLEADIQDGQLVCLREVEGGRV